MARPDPLTQVLQQAVGAVWEALQPAERRDPPPPQRGAPAGAGGAQARRHEPPGPWAGATVTDGDAAVAEGLQGYYAAGGTAPADVAMGVQLAARYGARVVLPARPDGPHELVALVPAGDACAALERVLAVVGFRRVLPDPAPATRAWAWWSP